MKQEGRGYDGGFTLMEMVVAVFVVAVMIAVVTPHLMGAGTRAKAVACEQDERTITAALTEYQLLYGAMPVGNSSAQLQTLVTAELLQSVPAQPDNGSYVIQDTDTNNIAVTCSSVENTNVS